MQKNKARPPEMKLEVTDRTGTPYQPLRCRHALI
jgi:hypothetical protein